MKQYQLSKALCSELEEVKLIYEEAKSSPYTVWNNIYPSLLNIQEDFKNENLYVFKEDDKIVGAISIETEPELVEFCHFTDEYTELSRVVIKKDHQGMGLSKMMVQMLLVKLGVKRVRLAVEVNNIPAVSCYNSLKFIKIGEIDMYSHHYYVMEKTNE